MPTLGREVASAKLPTVGDVFDAPNTVRNCVTFHHLYDTSLFCEKNQGWRYVWSCTASEFCTFRVILGRPRRGHKRIPDKYYIVSASEEHSCRAGREKTWSPGKDLPYVAIEKRALPSRPPKKGQKGFEAYQRLRKLKRRASPKWIDKQVDLLVKLIGLKTALKEVHGLVAARDIWRFPLPNRSHPNYNFECFFLLLCSAGISDIPLCKTCKNIFDSYEHGISPLWIDYVDLEHLVELLKPMSKQNINAERLKLIASDILENHHGELPRDFEVLCKYPGVGPKIAALTLWELYGIVAAIPVDVHLFRCFNALGWTFHPTSVDECRLQVQSWLPKMYWPLVNEVLASFGQHLGQKSTRMKLLQVLRTYNRRVKVAIGKIDRATPKRERKQKK